MVVGSAETGNALTFSLANQTPLGLAVLLVLAHFVCDFSLQSDRMAREKYPGHDSTLPWGWWLTAHASTHGLAVALLTGLPLLGLLETMAHALIDWAKGRWHWSMGFDQILHLGCKLGWLVLLLHG